MSVLRSLARRNILYLMGLSVAVFLVAATSSASTSAARPGSGQTVSRQAVPGEPRAGLQQAADQLVADGVPGVIIMTRRGQQVSNVVAGLADKATGRPMQPQDRVHIGSITKTFVATVVLQLAAEGRLSLNDSVQKWLPGVITGHGYDPAQITIRQLLQHTSGVRDYTSAPGFLTPQNFAKPWQPRQLVDIALRLGPPVHGWLYSNTNYILLGMIIQKVTGQSPMAEIRDRILVPLGLHGTSFPLTSKQVPAPYAHGYFGPVDVTNQKAGPAPPSSSARSKQQPRSRSAASDSAEPYPPRRTTRSGGQSACGTFGLYHIVPLAVGGACIELQRLPPLCR
ncbi:MAG: beta-lactamase family protein [Microlunatus sp.]|nr:beta-lactamase family protein [Microlunatus sp.]